MKYTSRLAALTIGLAVGLSSFVIFILLIIAIVCCCKRSRNRSNKSADNNTLPADTYKTNEPYEPPSDQMYANHLYVQPKVQSLYANEGYEQPSTELYANALELKRR